MINGIGMQRLAQLGYEHFVNFIEFIEVLLRNSRNNYKKMQRHKRKNLKLKNNCKKYGNRINKKRQARHRSNPPKNPHQNEYTAEYRLNKNIDKFISEHAQNANKTADEVLDCYISYKYRAQSTIFTENKTLTVAKQKEFQRLQKQYWDDFKTDPTRITNLTFNYALRYQSFRDIQGHRTAVM